VEAVRGAAHETAIGGNLDEYGGNFKERIRAGIKSARFDVDDYRQKAAKSACHESCRGRSAVGARA
jgi:hypothetical protein